MIKPERSAYDQETLDQVDAEFPPFLPMRAHSGPQMKTTSTCLDLSSAQFRALPSTSFTVAQALAPNPQGRSATFIIFGVG